MTTSQQLQLRHMLQLDDTPRTEGPAAATSIAHRVLADSPDNRLVLDLARTGESGWVLALFFEGTPPTADTVADHRTLLRSAVEQFGLTLVEVTPAATADEVHTPPHEPTSAGKPTIGTVWDLPYDDLDHLWPHVGLRKTAPADVKAAKLREVMRSPAWSAAPPILRRQAEAFLDEL
ncbi:hypothetical protein [Verrucosispora sp. NA02020]|uniref:hypothetical protein n=1 Tax=Verrucosispora sp. NA02020 TaxID=2742132 RepID=UPI0020CA6835|nr:hypothetical protein [Verrucosispora sp. NA02020]